MNMETNEIEKISILPKPLKKPHPQLWQVVDSTSSIGVGSKERHQCDYVDSNCENFKKTALKYIEMHVQKSWGGKYL
ncbi:MAG: hypothetical protein Ct9H300mP21_00940 [Pseudomonadota bacterium]|nr:MAG: hypothetical protein Ct9H300mP21_00940 [Pseudomonadota bacterium]